MSEIGITCQKTKKGNIALQTFFSIIIIFSSHDGPDGLDRVGAGADFFEFVFQKTDRVFGLTDNEMKSK